MTSIDPLNMVFDPRKDEFVRAYRERLESLRNATLLALNQLFDAALETAKARQRLNKLVIDSPVFTPAQQFDPRLIPFEYSRLRVDVLLDDAVEDCVRRALAQLKQKYRSRVYAPGWEGSTDLDDPSLPT